MTKKDIYYFMFYVDDDGYTKTMLCKRVELPHLKRIAKKNNIDYWVEPLHIEGKTYKEKQNNLQSLAIDFSLSLLDGDMLDLSIIYNFFESNAKRFGLIKEFRENAII